MIIDWDGEDVNIEYDEKEKKELFLRLLAGQTPEGWDGMIFRKDKAKLKQRAPVVQVRCSKGEAQVLISIGIKKDRVMHGKVWGKHHTEPCVLMSQNGTAEWQAEDFAELNLAVLEAQAVYESVVAENEK